MKIIIADDDQSILDGLVYIISNKVKFPCDIIPVTDALEALQRMETINPDLIITDIKMPGMSGLEFIEEVKKKQKCRFVILTGYEDFDFAMQAVRFHVEDYLLKPVDKNKLIEIIERVHDEINSGGHPVLQVELPAVGILDYNPVSRKYSENIRNIIKIINNDYMNDVSLKQIAEKTGLNLNYICLLSKKETGMTFLQYVDYVRIKNVAEMLIYNPEKSIQEIFMQSGYISERQFFKVYKKRIGMTPGQFRKIYSRK